jgi:adenosylhomocysteine nucleosidase
MKILIVTPMQEEFDFFLHYCREQQFHAKEIDLGRIRAVHFSERDVTVARGGLGKVQFAVRTQHLLDMRTDWETVICAGAAGGLVDTISVGDVVVATSTVEHDYYNKFGKRHLPEYDGAQNVMNALKHVPLPSAAFTVHFGPIASGDEDIVMDERRRELHQSTEALAVAWEGIGGAKACAFSEMPFVEIRGITDDANHHASSDFKKNLERAMRNVAALIVYWITFE